MGRSKVLRSVDIAIVATDLHLGSFVAANAATIVYSSSGPYAGSVTGIFDLVVDAVEYDVMFLYGSYNTTHVNESAHSNATGLMDAINFELNTPTIKAVARPAGTPADFRVSTSLNLVEVSYYTSVVNILSGLWERQVAPPGPFTVERTTETMWAVVSVSPAVVPVPAALPLLATCLGALGFIGWRRKRTACIAA